MVINYLLDIVILLAAAVLAVPLFRAAGLGAVPGFLVAGVLVGPYGLALIDNVTEIGQLAELGCRTSAVRDRHRTQTGTTAADATTGLRARDHAGSINGRLDHGGRLLLVGCSVSHGYSCRTRTGAFIYRFRDAAPC